ncbi:RHS repeat domain-containing protein [Akkermansia muciniphila]|uniref:RHS repeat domain-containing protein n=1 Tax=Akkermansia muciniphila TaxID=239935 RepID=UPI00211DAADF|nr:RHS repeat-associated core domain-containing protein [Akkermansia muciniphila]
MIFLRRPVTRTQRRGTEPARSDSFSYNGRNELTGAALGAAPYGYSYDNIGNRKTAQEPAQELAYAANELNQYARIEENAEAPFVPTYDASGNQTLIKTSTGVWTVVYNAANRAVSFTSRDGATVVECGYDYQGRRYMKKVTQNGTVASHERCLYRGYLQIAALDMLNSRNVIRTLLWDPLEPMATRPLALVQGASLYCYGVDFNKNVSEVFDAQGTIAAAYDYSPYGAVTGTGSLGQPVQWSGEMHDEELALVYYNYRYYNPKDGRWINRDPIAEQGGWNLYGFVDNGVVFSIDYLGKETNEFGYTMTIPAGYIPILLIIEGSISIEKKKNCVCIEAKLRTDVGIGVGIGLKIKQKWWPILPDIEYSLKTMIAGLSNEKILKIDNCNGKTSTSYREELLGFSHRMDAGITLSSYIQASYSIDFKISSGLTLNAKPISLTLDATGYIKIDATLKIPFIIDQNEELVNKSFNENIKIWSK